jgi:hypothetical protein
VWKILLIFRRLYRQRGYFDGHLLPALNQAEPVTMDMPAIVATSKLFQKLSEDQELLGSLVSLRSMVAELAETTGRTVPNFTDHTIRHMDALWRVADQVLSADEIRKLNTAEAFILGTGFYLHDCGMAYAATDRGFERLKESASFKSFLVGFPTERRDDPEAVAAATAAAVRQLHANAAKELAINEIPGSNGRFLFEAKTVRELWGATCGEIASSHHWNLSQLENQFGKLGIAPLADGRTADLLYVASCLRIIDYAHINRERASSVSRAFRGSISSESVVHWLAQENIDGPLRDNDELVFRAATPVSNVDAWWLFYEMMSGLDAEIRSVYRMLEARREEFKRISLMGVRGASSPETAAKFIPTSGFLPIEINLRAGSIDRLVELLAGETLYGPNPMTPVRELIQNSRDAVLLKSAVATSDAERALLALPITVTFNTKSDPQTLEVVDHGIGMSRKVMTDYLISIASDYWTTQFATDFPLVAERGFKNAGKFGIGFLSTFMIGDEVEVESNRVGEPRYKLTLHGVGRRGELRQVDSPGGSGTVIRIRLKKTVAEKIKNFDKLVPCFAPTLPHNLVVSIDGEKHTFPVNWFRDVPLDEVEKWVEQAFASIRRPTENIESTGELAMRNYRVFMSRYDPTPIWPKGKPEFTDGNTRLVASFLDRSLLCVRGLAVQSILNPALLE